MAITALDEQLSRIPLETRLHRVLAEWPSKETELEIGDRALRLEELHYESLDIFVETERDGTALLPYAVSVYHWGVLVHDRYPGAQTYTSASDEWQAEINRLYMKH